MIEKIEEKVYRAMPQISQSTCKDFISMSPFAFKFNKDNPKPATSAMIRGTLAHQVALEGHKIIVDNYAYDNWPSLTGKKRTAGGYQQFKKELLETGKPYIKEEDLKQILGICQGVERSFAGLLKDGTPEIAIHSLELIAGIPCKGLIDFLPAENFIFDLKTTAKKLTDRQMESFLYADNWCIQAAFYCDLYKLETGEDRDFVFLIVADKEPFETRKLIVPFDSDCIRIGRELYTEALEGITNCEKEGEWPEWKRYIPRERN